jgi:phage baseplate assembly protein W
VTVSDLIGTGIAFPLHADRRGGLALVRDEVDIDQALHLILGTAPGERPMRPEFGCGVHNFIFDRIDAETTGQMEREIRIALDRWEPRIEVESVDFDLVEAGQGRIDVLVGYKVRATNHVRNLVHPFYVVPAEDAG